MSPASHEGIGAVSFFRLPEYDEAFGTYLSEVMHGLASAMDPILAKIPRVVVRRMYRGRNSVETTTTVDPPGLETKSTFGLNHDLIAAGDVESFLAEMHSLAEQYVASVVPQFFATMSMVTDAFGNTHDAGGQPFSWDMYLDLLERMEVAFDETDNPVLPTLVTGPDFIPPEITEEQDRRKEAILEAKRDAHLARRRHRRISRKSL
jgi:hypothetical protein